MSNRQPITLHQAAQAAAYMRRRTQTTYFLRAPVATASVAAASAGTIGMAAHLAVLPKGPEPGWHPQTHPGMPVFESVSFGIAAAGLYATSRAAWDVARAKRRR
jgi:hypothetical protein